jgi:hypothetical protein
MPKRRPWLVEADKPSYYVVKWICGGGFGQLYKVVRDRKACNIHMNAVDRWQLTDENRLLRASKSKPRTQRQHWTSIIT